MTPASGGDPLGVLHVLNRSGRDLWFSEITSLSDRRRWRPVIVTLDPPGDLHRDLAASGVATGSLDVRRRADLPGAAIRLRRLIDEHGASLVHAHLLEPSLLAMLAALGSAASVRLISRHHSTDHIRLAPIAAWKRSALLGMDRLSMRLATAVIVPSRRVLEEAAALGAERAKLHVVPLGRDIAMLERVDVAAAARLRAELAPHAHLVGVMVGRLAWEKDYETALRAWARVRAFDPTATLVICGEGPLRARLSHAAAELGLSDAVVLAGFRSDIRDVMAGADVFLHTARVESTGLAILEALAVSRPAVVTPVGVVGEDLIDGVHCSVVPFGDAAAAAEAVVGLARDREAAAAMARRGRDLVRERFGIGPMVRRWEDLYELLLTRR